MIYNTFNGLNNVNSKNISLLRIIKAFAILDMNIPGSVHMAGKPLSSMAF